MKHKTPKLNKILASLVAACLVLGLLPVVPLTASANPGGGGSGTAADPWRIGTPAEFAAFRDNVNAGNSYLGEHIKLTADINISGYSNWTPIGTSSNQFRGIFCGGGYEISGLTITGSLNNRGLFGYIGTNGTVMNLKVSGSITGVSNVGGIAWYLAPGALITRCISSVNIFTYTGSFKGGIVGENAGTVSNCIVTGNVQGDSYLGGIVGYNRGGSIRDNYMTGNLLGTAIVSGIVGRTDNSNVSGNVYLGTHVEATGNSAAGRIFVNGYDLPTIGSNIGRSDMTLMVSGTSITIVDNATGRDGATAVLGSNTNANVFGGFFGGGWSADIWNIPDGNLNMSNLPTHQPARTVIYNGNGNTSGSVISALRYGNANTVTTAGATTSAGTLTKTGYTFTGWNTQADGSGTSYAPGATFSITADTTLYAEWEGNTYSIRFNGNGNDGGSMSNQTHTYGSSLALTSNAFTKAGHVFAGWDTDPSGTTVIYHNHDTVLNLTSVQGEVIDLYAVWLAGGYNVYFNENGGSGGTESVAAMFGEPMPDAVMPLRDGYVFLGYFDARTGGIQYYNCDGSSARNWDKTENTTLYARWIRYATVHGYNDSPPDGWSVTYNDGRTETDSNEADVNVQAMIVDVTPTIYKIDIEWGGMKFEYVLEGERYDADAGAVIWKPAAWEGMDGDNNKITVTNHSNADVKVSLDITENLLAPDVDMEVFTANVGNSGGGDTPAKDLPLDMVLYNMAPLSEADSLDAYLWLGGVPFEPGPDPSHDPETWHRVGIITVTIIPDAESERRTPR